MLADEGLEKFTREAFSRGKASWRYMYTLNNDDFLGGGKDWTGLDMYGEKKSCVTKSFGLCAPFEKNIKSGNLGEFFLRIGREKFLSKWGRLSLCLVGRGWSGPQGGSNTFFASLFAYAKCWVVGSPHKWWIWGVGIGFFCWEGGG